MPKDLTLGAIVRASIDYGSEAAHHIRRESGPHGGVIAPLELFTRSYTPTTGEHVIPTTVRGDLFINPLAAKTILKTAGARFVQIDQPGRVKIPKSTAVTVNWTEETGAAPAAATPSFSSLTANPHTLASTVDITHLLKLQSDILEYVLVELITNAMSEEIDKVAFAGTGSNGQPKGLINTTGVNAETIATAGSPTAAEIAAFIDDVADDNADDTKVAFVAPSKVRKALRDVRRPIIEVKNGSNAVVSNYGGELILGPDGRLFDKPLHVSNVAPAKKLVAGDFSELLVATWGKGVEIMFDRVTHSKYGATRVCAFLDADVIVRNPAAFAVGTVLA